MDVPIPPVQIYELVRGYVTLMVRGLAQYADRRSAIEHVR